MNDLLKNIDEMKSNFIKGYEQMDAEAMKTAKDLVMEKANEVEHTTNTWYGKELVPVDVLSTQIYNAIPEYGTFINAFTSGFHGNDMGTSDKVVVKWEIALPKVVWEWTTWAWALSQGNTRLPTWEVSIVQYSLQVSVDVSKKQLNHSVVDLLPMLTADLWKSFARGIEVAILNADPAAGATGNVNSDDQLFTTTFSADDVRFAGYTWFRALAVAGTAGVDKLDVWTLDITDLFTSRGQLGLYSIALNDLVLIMDYVAYNKALTISEFLEYNKNGQNSTAIIGAISNIAWVDLFVSREFPKTQADGKMSKTAASNVKGWFLYALQSCVQRGYGQPIDTDIVKVPGKGYQIIGTMEFGFTIINKKAWVTDPAFVLWFNAS